MGSFQRFDLSNLRLMILADPKDGMGAGIIDIYPTHICTECWTQIMIELPRFWIQTRNEIRGHRTRPDIAVLIRGGIVWAIPGNRMRPFFKFSSFRIHHSEAVAVELSNPEVVLRVPVHSPRLRFRIGQW